jgi:hypothetical protein
MNLAVDFISNLRAYDFFLAILLCGEHLFIVLHISPTFGMVQVHYDAFDVLYVCSCLRGIWYFLWNNFQSCCKYE